MKDQPLGETFFSVQFDNGIIDDRRPIVHIVRTPLYALHAVIDDIVTRRRHGDCGISSYTISEYNTQTDKLIETLRTDEFMAAKNLEVPAVKAGDYVNTPHWLRGKQSNKKPTCIVSHVASRWHSESVMLVELTNRGPSKDVRRRHFIWLADIDKLRAFNEWRMVGTAPNVQWVRCRHDDTKSSARKIGD